MSQEEDATAEDEAQEPEPTATLEPEPTATPEPPTPTPSPEPTATPTPSPTPVPATATPSPSVAFGVPVTPVGTTAVPPPPGQTPAPTATPTPLPFTGTLSGWATRYADSLDGNMMACGGIYRTGDIPVLAVGLSYDQSIPCGTPLKVCNGATCIDTVRTDTCPGCEGAHIDLSRAAFEKLCGVDPCNVTISRR